MPFSRYLADGTPDDHNHDDDHNLTFSPVQFQLPNLILSAPAVPPGGGAEALPAGLYAHPSLAWFSSPEGSSSFSFQQPSASYQPPPPPSASSSSPSVSFPVHLPYSPSHHIHHQPQPQLPLSIPSGFGLPVYSSSGFDLLSILARVVNRPFPKIYLGPVDLSCSFVITDTRRFDAPIVYASPTFYKLTGYDEHEVIGRNCRFLQAPGGTILRGQDRTHTAPDAVAHLRKNIIADKECQVSMINYRKDGSAFINMVSVIPIRGGVHNASEEADDIVYHVGFQVDLSEQPKAILSKLRDGTYIVNYSDKSHAPSVPPGPRDWRTSSMTMRGMSNELRALISDPSFTNSFKLSTNTHASTALALSTSPAEPLSLDPYDGNKPLHIFLLDRSPDFLHVVSLKGAFLYAAPAVRTVLGYEPEELVGRSLTDFCHPADRVPLMRELKEASATPGLPTSASSAGANANAETPPPASGNATPRPVDLLFRMQAAKGRGYVWIECRGRLHVEPGKGRKAIILSGRVRHLPHLEWGPIAHAGGLVPPLYKPVPPPISSSSLEPEDVPDERPPEREFWGMLSANGTFLYAGAAVRDVLGWGAGEVIGKALAEFVTGGSPAEVRAAVDVEIAKVVAVTTSAESAGLACDALTKERGSVPVHIVLYRSHPGKMPAGLVADGTPLHTGGGDAAAQAPIVCQVKLCANGAPPATHPIMHAPADRVFEETELGRGSSWQYELQQLKFRNLRLAEEVLALEAALGKKIRRKQSLGAMAASAIGARSAAAAAPMPIAYQHPHGGMQQQQHPHPQMQASQPLNVRFVTTPQGVPVAHPSTARSHPPPAPSAMSQPASASVQSQQITPPMPPPMPPPAQPYAPPGPPPSAQAPPGAPVAYQPQPLPPRMQHSFGSALEGWSHYGFEQPEAGVCTGVGAAAAGGLAGRAGSFGSVPMKRTWDSSLRDAGGGGGGGGV